MENQQANQLIMMYGNMFPAECLNSVRSQLETMDYAIATVQLMQLKDPTIALILSVLLGYFGVDRFYIGDIGMGVGKLLTCGGLYVWTIVDMFLIMDATREKNYSALMGMES